MDSLIIVPFSLWGLNPFISKNLKYSLEIPKIKGIPIYKSDDYGLVLRKDNNKADSLPLSTLYSIQFPNDGYSQFGIGFSRFISKFLLSTNYDYNYNFKQASISIDYNKFSINYYEIFKLENHLQFFDFSFSPIFDINYQIFNDTNVIYFKLLDSEFIYSQNQQESYVDYSIQKNLLKMKGGIYYNFIKKWKNFNYMINIKPLEFVELSSQFRPFQFRDSVYNFQKHSLAFNYKFIKIAYSYEGNLIPIDTSNWEFSYIHILSILMKSDIFQFYIERIFNSPIEMNSTMNLKYNYKLTKDVIFAPYISMIYFKNNFEIPLEDIFSARFGLHISMFGGTDFDFNFASNLSFKSLWENKSYGLFIRIKLED
jgi:hypothetical protein